MRPKNEAAAVNVLLRKNRENKFGAYPIIIQVTKDRKSFIKSLGYDCLTSEWDEEKQRPNMKHPKYLELKTLIDDRVGKMDSIMMEFSRNNKNFSVNDLKAKLAKKTEQMVVLDFFDRVIEYLTRESKIGTADSYKNTKRIIQLFCGESLQFSEIDYAFLRRLLTFLRMRGNNDRTLFFYFKTLRALINRAIKEGKCLEGDYGFKDFSLAQFDRNTQRKAISVDEIKKIEALDLKPYSAEWNARNYFLFSFYVRGINMVDIAQLKSGDIVNGRLKYIRTKTHVLFSVKLIDKAFSIINFYKGHTFKDYLFPVFDAKHDSPRKQKDRINSLKSSVNKALKEIATKGELQCHLNFYVGRHSYATALKFQHVPIAAISELMGHEDVKTTEIYLKSFGDDTLDVFDELLYGNM